jgi:hypothetical protein
MLTVYLFESDDEMLPILNKSTHVGSRPMHFCPMARQPRVNTPETLYPMMACINRRRMILHDDAETTVIVGFLFT